MNELFFSLIILFCQVPGGLLILLELRVHDRRHERLDSSPLLLNLLWIEEEAFWGMDLRHNSERRMQKAVQPLAGQGSDYIVDAAAVYICNFATLFWELIYMGSPSLLFDTSSR